MNSNKILTLLACAALGSIGCGGDAASTTAPTNAAPTSTTAPKPTTVSTNGATATTGAVPADFPKDVPVYKDATVISAASQGGTNYGAVLSTSDASDAVATYYKDELKKNGWSEPQAMNAGGTNILRATKEKRQVAITIGKSTDGKTNISIGITAMP